MTKTGRNDPCPCGSGKKYKRCHGASLSLVAGADESPPDTAPTQDRRAMERTVTNISRILNRQEFGSIDEVNAYVHDLLAEGDLPTALPGSALQQAQELIYDAWEAHGPRRVELARRALQLSPDCADAYVLLAEEAARTAEEALELYTQGVAAGERALGDDFQEFVGHFWAHLETRPYMRARSGLAQTLWELGGRQEAIQHYWDMLRLNPGDNQGIRYILLAWLLEVGDQPGAQELLDRYTGDIAASWAYGRALHAFREHGDTARTRALLEQARKTNPCVPAYLLGSKRLPRHLPEYIGIGDEREGIACAHEQMVAWHRTPGALAWLEQSLKGERGGRSEGRSAAADARQTIPRDLRPHYDALVKLTNAVCQQHLNEEYAQLSRRLAAALCRKRPAPVTRGRLEGWACGIVYAIGSVNFLFDKTQTPHCTTAEVCALFGVSPSTGAAKAAEIRKMFRMGPFEPEWCLPSKLDQNPLAWMITVNGLLVDARYAPREVQEEALRRGLIPHLPETHG